LRIELYFRRESEVRCVFGDEPYHVSGLGDMLVMLNVNYRNNMILPRCMLLRSSTEIYLFFFFFVLVIGCNTMHC